VTLLIGQEATSGLGVSHGTSAKAAFDRWFRYPAGLSQHALSRLFAEGRNPSGGAIVDPFCGAATVGTRAASVSRAFVGVEAHPEIANLARLKLAPAPAAGELAHAAAAVAAAAAMVSTERDVSSEIALVGRCFDPKVLSVLVNLRDAIKATDNDTTDYLKWALLATLRDVANVKVGWPYLRPNLARTPPHSDAAQRFVSRVGWMAKDLATRTSDPVATIVDGDSGSAVTWAQAQLLEGPKGSVALTSPPYLNNFDYADATRLEMYFWGRNTSWSEMVADVRADMLVATTQQSSKFGAEFALEGLTHLPRTRQTVIELSARLTHERETHSGGKEYDRVLPEYMLGITRVLEQLTRNLVPGSWCGWVVGDSAPYGIYVDTPGLIQAAATEQGYSDPESEVLRARGLRWRTNGTRHQVALDERIVWMRTPI